MNASGVADQLRARIGLDPQSLGTKVLTSIVAERMKALGITDEHRYAAHLADSTEEFDALIEDVVVPETWFFRGGKVFSYLAEHVRRATDCATSRTFRILSAPCSSGEEPYSLVIALMEAGIPQERWTIDGVDVSSRGLSRARRGFFRDMAFREIPPELKGKYFRKNDDGWELLQSVRSLVRFRQGNLLDPEILASGATYDLIFCRNLLIYLHETARASVLANLDRLLAPQGLLCMGHAEPWTLLDQRFRTTGPRSYFLFERAPATETLSLAPAKKTGQPAVPQARKHKSGRRLPRRSRQLPEAADSSVPIVPLNRLVQARQEADAGTLEKALQSCKDHLCAAHPTADAYSLLGVIHQARKERTQAIDCFRKALYLDPQHEEALLHLSLLYQENGEEAAANLLRRRLDRKVAGGES